MADIGASFCVVPVDARPWSIGRLLWRLQQHDRRVWVVLAAPASTEAVAVGHFRALKRYAGGCQDVCGSLRHFDAATKRMVPHLTVEPVGEFAARVAAEEPEEEADKQMYTQAFLAHMHDSLARDGEEGTPDFWCTLGMRVCNNVAAEDTLCCADAACADCRSFRAAAYEMGVYEV